jgi:hypothetical protein
MSAGDWIAAVGVTTGILTAGGSFYRWGVPHVRQRSNERRERRHREQAVQDVLLGRPAIDSNPITGEPGIPELPSMGERITYVTERVHELAERQADIGTKVSSIADEVKSTTNNRLISLEDITNEHTAQIKALHTELKTLKETGFTDRRTQT